MLTGPVDLAPHHDVSCFDSGSGLVDGALQWLAAIELLEKRAYVAHLDHTLKVVVDKKVVGSWEKEHVVGFIHAKTVHVSAAEIGQMGGGTPEAKGFPLMIIHIKNMGVHHFYRGKGLHIGTQLVKAAIQELADKNRFRALFCGVRLYSLPAAKNFYRVLGFEAYGSSDCQFFLSPEKAEALLGQPLRPARRGAMPEGGWPLPDNMF